MYDLYPFDNLQLQSDGSAPPPLLTAVADKVPYPEAKEVYQRINTSINLSYYSRSNTMSAKENPALSM
jgi:hypothetical protein